MGDASSVTSSSSSHSMVIRALPSRVYSPHSGLSPKRYENILPSCFPSKNTNSRHGILFLLPPPHRNRAFAPPALLPTASKAVGSDASSSCHTLTALRTISFLYSGDSSLGQPSSFYYRSVSIIALAEPILVQNPGLHLRSPPSERCTKRTRGVASLASPRLTQRRR